MPKGHRYVGLDGLRGIAALTVVAHHIQLSQNVRHGPFWSGYLSVDLFFMISGFVIAAAYEPGFLKANAVRGFAVARARRLYPMIAVGTLVSVFAAMALHDRASIGLASLSQLLLLPFVAGGGVMFLLNGPYWSLLFEVAANAAHVLLFRWATTRALALGVLASALVLVVICEKFGSISGGWSAHNAWVGAVRVTYGYGLGVLTHRLHESDKLPHIGLPAPLLGALFVASIAVASASPYLYTDCAMVLGVFPFLLLAGIGARGAGAWAAILGAASYPLYVVHAPLIRLWAALGGHGLLSAAGLLAAFMLAAVALDLFVDRPVRALLAQHHGVRILAE